MMKTGDLRRLGAAAGCVVALGGVVLPLAATAGEAPQAVKSSIFLLSASAKGAQGNGDSFAPVFLPGSRSIVAFHSTASNLVPGDTNAQTDVFVKDLQTGEIVLVSTTATGGLGNGASWGPTFSPDGTRIAFTSTASNLVPGDKNDASDVFVKTLPNSNSLAPEAGAPGLVGPIVAASTTAAKAFGNDISGEPVFSPDGTQIAFSSYASNLVPGDKNDASDVFVKSLKTGAVTLVSATASGAKGNSDSGTPSFSPDGTQIAFQTAASNLVAGAKGIRSVVLKNLTTKALTLVSSSATGVAGNAVSTDPAFAAWGRKPQMGTNAKAATALIAFTSYATNLVTGDTNLTGDVFIKDPVSGAIIVGSTTSTNGPANGESTQPTLSPDGRWLAFSSAATNLVTGDTNGKRDIFVKDLEGGTVTKLTVSYTGGQSNGDSFAPKFSADSAMIAFYSNATNLVNLNAGNPKAKPLGTNGHYHAYAQYLPFR